MDTNKLGEEGQKKAKILCHEYFKETVFQIDWMSVTKDGIYILNEVKNQEPFDPPPFEGQGLPLWQVKARIKFYRTTGTRCRFIVFNPLDDTDILWQWLDVLEEEGQHFDTQGLDPQKRRRIYPIDNFKKLDSNIAMRILKIYKWEAM